jgi:phosphate-selective porin OprO and OprP
MRLLAPSGRLLAVTLALWAVCGQSPSVHAQTSDPDPAPASTQQSPTLAQIEERLRATEAMNRKLADQLDRVTREHDEQSKQLSERFAELTRGLGNGVPGASESGSGISGGTGAGVPGSYPASPVPDYTEGRFTPNDPAPDYPDSNIISPYDFTLRASFGPGFQIQTQDGRYRLQVHYESQVEGRAWSQQDQLPANSGLFLPRQRIFFNGNLTDTVEYEFAINRGLNNINLLNAYLNFHFDDRFELRMGRFFTPFTYDQYAVSNYWLVTPERSLFTTNLSPNRQIGLMAWGYLFDKRFDYSVGVFNGSRNSFEDLNSTRDVVGYINARPFQNSEVLRFARFLNLGSSVAFGRQDQSPVPVSFRVAGGSPDANIPGVATLPFLTLNSDVVEQGDRLLGSVHAAYFYRGPVANW